MTISQWPTKRQSHISFSSQCGIIAESITFIASCHKALVAATQGDFKILRTTINPSAGPFSRLGLAFDASTRGDVPRKSFSFAAPGQRSSVKAKLGSVGQFNLQRNGCGSMRCAACYRAKVTRSLDACHWLSEDVSQEGPVRTYESLTHTDANFTHVTRSQQ